MGSWTNVVLNEDYSPNIITVIIQNFASRSHTESAYVQAAPQETAAETTQNAALNVDVDHSNC
eukprot:3492137-Amphidinium_carterae.1